MISYSQARIGHLQLLTQEIELTKQIDALQRDLTPDSTGPVWRFLDELRVLRTQIRQAQKELEIEPTDKPNFWQRLKVRLYQWSVKERFTSGSP